MELLSDDRAAAYIDELKADYDRVRTLHAGKKATPLVTLAEARANKTPLDWSAAPVKPRFLGRRLFRQYDLAELAASIDWAPFFQTWDLAGPYPAIRAAASPSCRCRPGVVPTWRRNALTNEASEA